MNTTSTPPVLKTLFPLNENRHLISSLAAQGHKLFCFEKYNVLIFEGDTLSTSRIKTILYGGVTG